MTDVKSIQKTPSANSPSKALARPNFTEQLIDPFNRLRTEFDRMFDDFSLRPLGAVLSRRLQGIGGPALEFKDNETAYELVAEVPGLKAEDIEIKIAEGVLRISGERKEEREGKENGFLFSERHYGHFERSIQLPAGVDEDKITATARDGLLTVALPKTAAAQQREKKIPVHVA